MGRGHVKLIGWDSEKEVSMKMEDALISKASLGLLVGESFKSTTRPVHKKEVLEVSEDATDKIVTLSAKPTATAGYSVFFYKTDDGSSIGEKLTATVTTSGTPVTTKAKFTGGTIPSTGDLVIVDYYIDAPAKAQTLTIAADKFAGTYLLEGETLWRNEDGVDVPALYTIPKLKILNDFSIEMASSGDPKPFNFNAEVMKDTKSTAMVIIDLIEE